MIINRRATSATVIAGVLGLAPLGVWAPGAVASAPAATQFELRLPGAVAGAEVGSAVATSGQVVVMGAADQRAGGQSQAGEVAVFDRPTTGWRAGPPSAILTAPKAVTDAEFGDAVAISGRTIVVGAPRGNSEKGVVYVYEEPAAGWKSTSHPTATLTAASGVSGDEFGAAVAVSASSIAVGAFGVAPSSAYFQGDAYMFNRPAQGWQTSSSAIEIRPAALAAFDRYGADLALSGSGDTLVVGAEGRFTDAGLAYVFVRPSSGKWAADASPATEMDGDQGPKAYFGNSVAISGATIVVGAGGETVNANSSQGAAFVYQRPAGANGWATDALTASVATLTASDGAAGDEFGSAVSVSGDQVGVGAPDRKVGDNTMQGEIYRFAKPSAGWTSVARPGGSVAADGASGDEYGDELAQSATLLVVGTDVLETSKGSAYLFALPGPKLSKPKQSHASWRLGSHPPKANPAHMPSGGTFFRFSLSQAASVSLVFAEKHGKHLVKRGKITFRGRVGANVVYFDGRITHGKQLTPGRCEVTISAKNADGASAARTLRFTTKHH